MINGSVLLCSNCCSGVSNDDWSHLDFYATSEEQAIETMASIEGSLELLGVLTYSHTDESAGYFNCAICSEIQCGSPEIFLSSDYNNDTDLKSPVDNY